MYLIIKSAKIIATAEGLGEAMSLQHKLGGYIEDEKNYREGATMSMITEKIALERGWPILIGKPGMVLPTGHQPVPFFHDTENIFKEINKNMASVLSVLLDKSKK